MQYALRSKNIVKNGLASGFSIAVSGIAKAKLYKTMYKAKCLLKKRKILLSCHLKTQVGRGFL